MNKPEPVESRGWWWLRALLVSLILGVIATGIAFGIRARRYMEDTGQGLGVGTIADLVADTVWIGAIAVIACLGVLAVSSRRS